MSWLKGLLLELGLGFLWIGVVFLMFAVANDVLF